MIVLLGTDDELESEGLVSSELDCAWLNESGAQKHTHQHKTTIKGKG